MTTYSRENPSPRFTELAGIYRQVHAAGLPGSGVETSELYGGRSLVDHIARLRELIEQTGSRTILDYGSGKGLLYKRRNFDLPDGTVIDTLRGFWGVDTIKCYDPGVPEFSQMPDTPSDGVICTDVLEHIPEEDIPWLLAEFFRLADRFVFATVAAFPASKTLPNGLNAHVTVRPPAWWAERIEEAAQGWRGAAYEFQVRERRGRVMRLARKLFGTKKYTSTTISSTTKTSQSRPEMSRAG